MLKAGGAYVPLDPGYPAERLRYMLEDSAPVVLLTQAASARSCSGSGAERCRCWIWRQTSRRGRSSRRAIRMRTAWD